MDYLIVYDRKETNFNNHGLAILENAQNVKIKEVINGEFTLSFILPRNDPKWSNIHEENFVKVFDTSQNKDQLFRIRSFDEQRNKDGKLTSNIQCEHVYYDALDCAFFPIVELIGQSPLQILQYAFSGTRFTIGTVEITTLTDILLDKAYPANIVNKLIENVGGELIKDNWEISLVQKRGFVTNTQFIIGKTIDTLKKTTDSKNLFTRIYPYGKDGMEITSVNGAAYIDSPLISQYDRPKIIDIDFKDIEDPTKLLNAALAKWSSAEQDGIDKPKVTYSGSFLELKKLKEYGDYEAFGIGDTVRIIDNGLNADTLQRIVDYEFFPYEPQKSQIALANYDPKVYRQNCTGGMIGGLVQTQSDYDKVTTSTGKLNPGWFENVKTKLKTFFNGSIKNAVVHSQGDIWVDNPDNPTKAMAILSDGFAIANNKLPNGDWDWKTFGTAADGFVADMITGGTLQGIKFRTAPTGSRMEITETGITKYNNSNKKTLKVVVDPAYHSDYGTIVFYNNDTIIGWIEGSPDGMQIYNTADYPINIGTYYYTNAHGVWNCDDAKFAALKDPNGFFYATRKWVEDQGYIKGTSGYTGNIVIGDVTLYFLNGLLFSVT